MLPFVLIVKAFVRVTELMNSLLRRILLLLLDIEFASDSLFELGLSFAYFLLVED